MKINPKVKKVLSVSSYILTAILILFVSVILYFNISGQVFFVFGRAVMWVKTDSMEPEIPAKSYILVKEATGEDVKLKDVIIFYSSDPAIHGNLNTHRVVEIKNDGREFVTKGDNNPGVDGYTARASKVIGIYSGNLPVLSFFGRFLSTSFGITVMFLLIFGITLVVFLPDALKYFKKKSKDDKINELIKEEIERLKSADEKNDKQGED